MTEHQLHMLLLVGSVYGVALIVFFILRTILNKALRFTRDKEDKNPTGIIFLKNSLFVLVFTAATIYLFTQIEMLEGVGKAMFASAGILAAVIGFASQKAFSNIIGGLFILFFKPFKVGDFIEIAGKGSGVVEELTLRHTVIRDYENKRIVIPNSVISEETVLNSSISDERIRKHITFGISYDSSVELARSIIQEEIMKHQNYRDYRSEEEVEEGEPPVPVRMIEHGDFAIMLKAWVWSDDLPQSFVLKCDVLESIKARFDAEDIEIPFPYRTIVYKGESGSTGKG